MKRSALSTLRCPHCAAGLELTSPESHGDEILDGSLACACGHAFPIQGGIPDLVFPRGQDFHHEDADTYDDLIDFCARLLNDDEAATRRRACELLEVEAGQRVLEVACGPASNFPYLLERIGPSGELWALDISADMLRVARDKLPADDSAIELLLANGVHLPFADRSFDALLHIGTLNRFPDVGAALAEMARVVKIGGKVVAGDEGLGPWLATSDYGTILKKFGSLFEGFPPLAAIPPEAREVRLQWLLGHAYYAIDFRVGEAAPALNLDVQLPGRPITVRDVLEAQEGKG
jgi:SAM-dependent methyltransferase